MSEPEVTFTQGPQPAKQLPTMPSEGNQKKTFFQRFKERRKEQQDYQAQLREKAKIASRGAYEKAFIRGEVERARREGYQKATRRANSGLAGALGSISEGITRVSEGIERQPGLANVASQGGFLGDPFIRSSRSSGGFDLFGSAPSPRRKHHKKKKESSKRHSKGRSAKSITIHLG